MATIYEVGAATIASALIAAVGKAETFERGRDLAALLELVPRQFDDRRKDEAAGHQQARQRKYLRKLLIHGARAALPYVAEQDTPLGRWAKKLCWSRAHPNVVVVAFLTNWRGSHGRCYGEGAFCCQGHAVGGVERLVDQSPWGRCSIDGDLRVAISRWPDSRTAFWKPSQKRAALDAECFYEDRSARISILAGRKSSEAGYVEAD